MTNKIPIYIFFIINSFFASAQPKKLQSAVYQALNNYTIYSNEVVHAANIMHTEFESINQVFMQYVEQSKKDISYKRSEILTEYDYFPVLPRDLYQKILDDNVYVPYDKRGVPLEHAGKIHNVVNELDELRAKLDKYVNSGSYKKDSVLQKGFELLRRAETLYFDLFTLQEKLQWSLQNIIKDYARTPFSESYLQTISKMQPVIVAAKEVLKSVRTEDAGHYLNQQCTQLSKLLSDLAQNKKTYLADIEPIDTSAFCPHKRYDKFMAKGQAFLLEALSYRNHSEIRYTDKIHKPYYYYYNIDLLSNYNRYGDGLVTTFNKFVQQSGEFWLWEGEFPLIYEVIYPQHPVYAEMHKTTPNLDPEELAKKWLAEQARIQDSLRQDSIKNAQKPPKVGDKTLEGFASNNLIFLLDVSSSMNEPEKLPLLKDALRELLTLMRDEDKITLITYSGQAQIVLEATSAHYKEQILEAIEKISSQSISDADLGINLAYQTALKHFIPNGNNRIIMATDGKFEIRKKTRKLIEKSTTKEIFLSIFYFSSKEFASIKTSLEQIASTGKGTYQYIQRENAQQTLLIEAQKVQKKQ